MSKNFGHLSGGPNPVDFAHDLFHAVPNRFHTRGTTGEALYSDIPVDAMPPTLRRLGADDHAMRFVGKCGDFEVSAIGHLNAKGDKYRHMVVSFHA
jgi:hypothetical protein